MSRYVISDLHIGHKNIHNFRGDMGIGLRDSQDHFDAALDGLSKLKKRDTVFLHGDIALSEEALELVKGVRCRNKILIVGNHCTEGKIKIKDVVEAYDQVYSFRKYKDHWQSHAPVHRQELRGRKNTHGHTHFQLMYDNQGELDCNYINTCVEYTSYKPITWEYAISDEYFQECKLKWERYNEKGLIHKPTD